MDGLHLGVLGSSGCTRLRVPRHVALHTTFIRPIQPRVQFSDVFRGEKPDWFSVYAKGTKKRHAAVRRVETLASCLLVKCSASAAAVYSAFGFAGALPTSFEPILTVDPGGATVSAAGGRIWSASTTGPSSPQPPRSAQEHTNPSAIKVFMSLVLSDMIQRELVGCHGNRSRRVTGNRENGAVNFKVSKLDASVIER